MSEPSELSPSGNPVYRHSGNKPFEMTAGDPGHIELLSKHIAQHLGEPGIVFHELVSHLVHVDVHMIPPRTDRNFYTLVTTGMSARSMKAPEGHEDFSYGELVICLPPSWKLTQEDFKDERNYWPVRLLKTLARMPHEYDTWLSYMHTIGNGEGAEPYAPNTKFCGAMLLPCLLAPEAFRQCHPSPEIAITFYAVFPLYAEEMDLKLKKGADVLLNRLEAIEANELVNLNRKNVARKLFGLF
jgi:hypothetical protein